MSTPRHPHHLKRDAQDQTEARFLDGEKAGIYVPQLYSQMRCDGMMGQCQLMPARAPMILVPPKPYNMELMPRKVFTTLHYCQRHTPEVPPRPEVLLNDRLKALIERRCKAVWPHEYKPDFDRCWTQWILVTVPEYRAFLMKLEQGQVVSGQGIPVLGSAQS